jgi:hypothetical protein
MEHDTKTDKKSKTTGTLPKSFYTPIDNGSPAIVNLSSLILRQQPPAIVAYLSTERRHISADQRKMKYVTHQSCHYLSGSLDPRSSDTIIDFTEKNASLIRKRRRRHSKRPAGMGSGDEGDGTVGLPPSVGDGGRGGWVGATRRLLKPKDIRESALRESIREKIPAWPYALT